MTLDVTDSSTLNRFEKNKFVNGINRPNSDNVPKGYIAATNRTIIDLTHFIYFMIKSDHVSGIQRVIQSMLIQADKFDNVIFSIRSKKVFWQFNTNSAERMIGVIENYIKWKRQIRLLLQKKTPLKQRIALLPAMMRGWKNKPLKLIAFRPSDTIFIFDAVWNNKPFLNSLSKIKQTHRVGLSVFVHDAIPYHCEDFVSFGSFDNFRSYLEWIDTWADSIYCNSNYSKQDLVRTKLVRKACDAIVTPLAHEFFIPQRTLQAPDDTASLKSLRVALRQIPSKEFALCVGTIEARKNQKLLVQVWSELQHERPMPLLVLAGKMGHQSEPLKIFIERENPPVLILEDIDDHTLERLYQECKFTVFPSLFEGWGLPVGESLWFAKPCLASNATSIPEVGGEYAVYFDPNSKAELKEKIREFVEGRFGVAPPDRSGLRRWRDVAAEILKSFHSLSVSTR